jgi:hypothetical protein
VFPFGHFSFRSLSYNCSAFRYSARHNDSGTPVRPAPCGLSRELSKGQTAEQRFGWRRSGGSLAFLSQLVAPTQLYRTAKQIGGYSLSRSRFASEKKKKDGFSEHHQQTFTIETMMTAHAYILPSCIGMTYFLSLSSYLVVICFTFAFG